MSTNKDCVHSTLTSYLKPVNSLSCYILNNSLNSICFLKPRKPQDRVKSSSRRRPTKVTEESRVRYQCHTTLTRQCTVIKFASVMMGNCGVRPFLFWFLMVFVWLVPLEICDVKLRLVSTETRSYHNMVNFSIFFDQSWTKQLPLINDWNAMFWYPSRNLFSCFRPFAVSCGVLVFDDCSVDFFVTSVYEALVKNSYPVMIHDKGSAGNVDSSITAWFSI